MSYATLYKPLIQSEITTSKSRMRVRKLYKIISYEYADGDTKQFRGSNAVLIFTLGIFRKKVYCLKVTDIKPDKFFRWLKTIMYKNLKESDFDNLKWLENLTPKADKTGTKLYGSSVKGKSIMKETPAPFRTYILPNIKQVAWCEFKMEAIEKIYGIKKADITEKEPPPKPIADTPAPDSPDKLK
jgi:hypothetical protein